MKTNRYVMCLTSLAGNEAIYGEREQGCLPYSFLADRRAQEELMACGSGVSLSHCHLAAETQKVCAISSKHGLLHFQEGSPVDSCENKVQSAWIQNAAVL